MDSVIVILSGGMRKLLVLTKGMNRIIMLRLLLIYWSKRIEDMRKKYGLFNNRIIDLYYKSIIK